jgi:2-keto-4-pentenoate hydratase
LPPRATDYTLEEVADAVSAMVGVEILDTAYHDNRQASALERAADLFSNGGFVCGTVHRDWRMLASAELEATLAINGETIVRKNGPSIGTVPLERAVVMVNLMRLSHGVQAGQVVTCGTYTGVEHAKPGDVIRAEFAGVGAVEFSFTA